MEDESEMPEYRLEVQYMKIIKKNLRVIEGRVKTSLLGLFSIFHILQVTVLPNILPPILLLRPLPVV